MVTCWAGCSNDEMEPVDTPEEPEVSFVDWYEEDGRIYPAESLNLNKFMADYVGYRKPDVFFNEDDSDQLCRIINSKEEFRAVYKGSKELPEIDFQRYSLILGRVSSGVVNLAKGNYISRTADGNYFLTVKIGVYENYDPSKYAYIDILVPVYFWGIYPKLSIDEIPCEVIRVP